MSGQKVLDLIRERGQIRTYIEKAGIHRMFLVCGHTVSQLEVSSLVCGILSELHIETVHFADFHPNPQYISVTESVQRFRREGCDGILAIGGGSAIDVAKCTKFYACMDARADISGQICRLNEIPLIAVPTTAGSGSEATRFAVVYREGKKLSLSHPQMIPSLVIRYASALDELPVYQKKATLLDALCHCMESLWSVNSTLESRKYAMEGIAAILGNVDEYLSGDRDRNQFMMKAAYTAGRAIDISQTTAGHAMSYKLTDLFGLAHGHAAALCVDKVLPHLLCHAEDEDICLERRGCGHLREIMLHLSKAMGGKYPEDAAVIYHQLLVRLGMCGLFECQEEDLETLVTSVNAERLKNHPVKLDDKTIRQFYRQMMKFTETEERA